MLVNSSEYLYSNLRFAMAHLDQTPAEAQINLLKTLIKAIGVFEDHVILRMYVTEPAVEIACVMPPKTNEPKPDTTTGLRFA
ncbi:MAG: hypothetical protein JW943_05870 [Deltaproteobacteria bacterium]|nr:hypothetical protein [Deltaproteobacteria bacterium]